jgi:hypothetical protein
LKNASGSLNLVTRAEDALTYNKAADLGTFLRREKHSPEVNADRFGTYLKPGKCNLTALYSLFVMKSPGTEDAIDRRKPPATVWQHLTGICSRRFSASISANTESSLPELFEECE